MFSLHSPRNGNLRHQGAVRVRVKLNCRGDVMRKILAAVVAAATLAGAAVATSGPAEARWGGGWHGGWHGGGWGWGGGGFVAGALVGSALASPYYRLRLRLSVRILPLSLLRAAVRVAALVERLRLGARLRLSRGAETRIAGLCRKAGGRPPKGCPWRASDGHKCAVGTKLPPNSRTLVSESST